MTQIHTPLVTCLSMSVHGPAVLGTNITGSSKDIPSGLFYLDVAFHWELGTGQLM